MIFLFCEFVFKFLNEDELTTVGVSYWIINNKCVCDLCSDQREAAAADRQEERDD